MSQDIDKLVLLAKKGDQEALEEVMIAYGYNHDKRLKNFLGKFYSLLVYGKINLKDKDTRRFLQLFIQDDDTREKLRYRYQGGNTQTKCYATADYIQHAVRSKLDREEVKSDLIYLFIEKVHRYKKKSVKISFGGYLYNSFRYDVFRYLQKTVFSEDMLNQEEQRVEDYLDELSYEEDFTVYDDAFYESIMKEDKLTVQWALGHCHELFDCLSVFERNILKMHYYDKLTDGKVADMMGLHINTIFQKRKKAVATLQSELEFMTKIGEMED